MINFLNKYNPSRTLFWLSIALIGKILISCLLFFTLDFPDSNGHYFIYAGDGPDYVKAAENIREYGTYSYYGTKLESFSKQVTPFTSRMPGYEIIILFFRLFANQTQTLYLTILFQLVLAAVSVYCLALTAKKVFNSNTAFYFTFFTYLFSTYIALFDITIMCESIAMSALIIAIYFLFRQKSNFDYLYAGAWLTWGIFLRQYYIPIFILFVIYVIWIELKKNNGYKKVIISTSLLVSSFAIADTCWIIRNYINTNKFIPVIDDLHGGAGKAPNVLFSLMNFVESWGGDIIWWNPKSEMILFMPTNSRIEFKNKSYSIESLPDYIYTSVYSIDSLKKVQEYYLHSIDPLTTVEDKSKYEKWLITNLDKYTQTFKKEKPLYYHIIAPLRLFPLFIFHSGTYNIINKPFYEQNILQKTIKLFYTMLYWLILIFGFYAVLYLLLKRYSLETILISLIPLYIVILCPLLLRRIEYRYFFPAYPFLLMAMCFILNKYCLWIRNKYLKNIIQKFH